MKTPAWTLWVTMVLVGTAGALLVSRGLAEETHEVQDKPNEVIKDFDIDYDDEEEVAPESVESLDEGKIKITTKTFKPPSGWKFKEFDADYTPVEPYDRRPFNPGSYVDIEIDPECLPPKVEAPTVTVPQDGVDAIKVEVTELTVPETAGAWPLKCEGNLQPPPGPGTQEFHWSAKIGRYTVYLTFDDGPLAGTDDCIAVLKSEDVKGTFFMVGDHMITDQRKQWVRDAHNNGNLIGNHSYSHWHHASNYEDPPTGKTNAEWLKDFQDNDAKIAEVLGSPAGTKYKYSRLPGKNAWRAGTIKKDDGNSARVADHISGNGYEIYGWDKEWPSTGFPDYTPTKTPQQMVDIIKNLLQNGPTMKPRKVIVLMHDPMFRTSTGNKQKLVDFIQGLKNCGLQIQFCIIDTYLTD